jgi:hypothetical protein
MAETVHELKTLARYYDAVVDGRKTFEVRLNDRAFQTGDILRLIKTDDGGMVTRNPPLCIEKRITYILRGGQFGIEPRYCVLGLGPVFPHPSTSKGE